MRAAILLVAPIALLAACGGGGGGVPSGPFHVDLTSTGAAPRTFQALSQASVQFTNKDTAAHQIASTGCPELNTASLAAGASATVTLPVGPKSCSFLDSLNPSVVGFQGSVDVLAPGNGY